MTLELSSERVMLQEVLAEAPVELGVGLADQNRCQALLDRLVAAETPAELGCDESQVNIPPEYKVARTWLSLALQAGGSAEQGQLSSPPQGWIMELVELARSQGNALWPPAQAWIYRALVWAERRDLLGKILPEQGLLTLPQADAWLESAFVEGRGWENGDDLSPHGDDLAPQRLLDAATERLQATETILLRNEPGDYPEVVAQYWWELIRLESLAAAGERGIEEDLADLSSRIQESALQEPAESWIGKELRRLAGRALAALVRLRLGMHRGDGGALLSPSAAWLARWEFAFLGGLAAWQRKDGVAAEANLREALRDNPHSTSVKYALAVFSAEQTPDREPGRGDGSGRRGESAEYALELLNSCLPSYAVRVARAGLLARLGRYSEAEAELSPGQDVLISEGMRYLWPRALEQARRQEALLKTALAERAGDSSQASLFWRKAFAGSRASNGLEDARQAFSAWVELAQPRQKMNWRRRVVQQRLEKGRQELFKLNAAASPDVLFFRAVVTTDFEPTLAARDIKMLLKRRPWVEKELQVGGSRILWLGDAALKMGQLELAQRAYDWLENEGLSFGEPEERFGRPDQLLAKRRALANLFQVVASDEFQSKDLLGEAGLESAFSEVVKAWDGQNVQEPCLMALIGWILSMGQSLARESQDFEATLSRARQSGMEDEVCLALDFLSSGRISPNLAIENLKQFPQAVRPLLVFNCGQSPEVERIRTFMDWAGRDWVSLSPVALQRIAAQVVKDAVPPQYDRALSWVGDNLGSLANEQWVQELQSWIRLHQALWLGRQGELEAAVNELHRAVNELHRADATLSSLDSVRKD